MNNLFDYRVNAYRSTSDYSDVLSHIAIQFDVYSKIVSVVGPWISKQNGKSQFLPLTPDLIKEQVSQSRLDYKTYSSMLEATYQFMKSTQGKRALTLPHPTTHHSAQFRSGLFSLTHCNDKIKLRDNGSLRDPKSRLLKLDLAGCEPLYLENIQNINPDLIKFIIIRPKLGKLGSPNISKWEVLMFRKDQLHLIDHVDSELNPRWAGKF